MAKVEPVSASTQMTIEKLWGWSFRETAGSTAVVNLRRGAVGGAIVCSIALSANESVGHDYSDPLELAGDPVYVEVNSGTVVGEVHGS